jgi:hypothetical protein
MRHLIGLSLIVGAILLALSGCTPADQQYCNSLGVAGTSEYSNCMSYYHTQEQEFSVDRAICDADADETYPRTLYDQGRYQPVFNGGGGFGGPRQWGGNYYGGGVSTVFVEPDHYRNAQVEQLRLRIVGPCMEARGWNSPNNWQAGRRTSAKKPRKIPAPLPRGDSMNQLPWLN